MGSYLLQNDVIGINKTSPDDLDPICGIENHPDHKVFILAYDKTRHLKAIRSDNELHLSVWEKASKRFVGFIILSGTNDPNRSLEFRRIIITSKGKGYGRQCLQLIKQHCFDRLNFNRLWLDVFTHNERAIHLYTSEGFKEEGTLREVIKVGNEFRSLKIMSILKREFYGSDHF